MVDNGVENLWFILWAQVAPRGLRCDIVSLQKLIKPNQHKTFSIIFPLRSRVWKNVFVMWKKATWGYVEKSKKVENSTICRKVLHTPAPSPEKKRTTLK